MERGHNEQLEGGWGTIVVRRGSVVLRSPKPQSETVLGLLAFLQRSGFEASPRPVDSGFSSDGREQLAFIPGESPQPSAWSDDAVEVIGRLLRTLHDLTRSWTPPEGAVWSAWFARDLGSRDRVIGHGDLGPWNILARDGLPVAFIDWDNAGPVDPVWELAHVAWQNAHLYDDDVAARNALPPADQRIAQCRRLIDAYGLGVEDRVGFVDKMIELAIRSAREEAVMYSVEEATESPTAGGYPLLWAVAWRARSAAWMLDHRKNMRAEIEAP